MLGALSAVTDDMNLVTNISVLPLHNPIQIAEQSFVLDTLSGGSFRLGVAIGWRDEEFEAYGVDKSTRVQRVEEGIELLRTLFTEESASYDGEIFSVDDPHGHAATGAGFDPDLVRRTVPERHRARR